MIWQAIGIVGLLLRLVGYLLGGVWTLLGVLKVAGVEKDERIDGPTFIGMGIGLFVVVFAFSMRKRAAKKRVAARKEKAIEEAAAQVREQLAFMREEFIKTFEEQLDNHNFTDPAQRAELLEGALRGFDEGQENAIREHVAKGL